MDNLITIKFFRVEKSYSHCIDFHEALDEALAVGPSPVSGERNINTGFAKAIIVRLEHLTTSRRYFVSGELIRKQISNIPPEANETGLTRIPLGQGSGLGLSAAFLFHSDAGVAYTKQSSKCKSKPFESLSKFYKSSC